MYDVGFSKDYLFWIKLVQIYFLRILIVIIRTAGCVIHSFLYGILFFYKYFERITSAEKKRKQQTFKSDSNGILLLAFFEIFRRL